MFIPCGLVSNASTASGASSITPDHLAARTLDPLWPLSTTVGTILDDIDDPLYIDTPTLLRNIVL